MSRRRTQKIFQKEYVLEMDNPSYRAREEQLFEKIYICQHKGNLMGIISF